MGGIYPRFPPIGYEFFKMGEDEVIGKRCYDLLDGGVPCSNCVSEKILETSLPAQTEKYLESKKVWMDIRAYPIHDMDGRVFRIVEHWRDITELKESQLSVIESEEKYRLLVENAKEAIFIYQDDKFRFSNRRARIMAKKIGLTAQGKPLAGFLHPDEPPDRAETIENQLKGLELKPSATLFRLISSQNEIVWVELNTVNLTWKGKPATLNFARDIN